MAVDDLQSWADTLEIVRLFDIETDIDDLEALASSNSVTLTQGLQTFGDRMDAQLISITVAQEDATSADDRSLAAMSRLAGMEVTNQTYTNQEIQKLRDELTAAVSSLNSYIDTALVTTIDSSVSTKLSTVQALLDSKVATVQTAMTNADNIVAEFETASAELLDELLPLLIGTVGTHTTKLFDVEARMDTLTSDFSYETLEDSRDQLLELTAEVDSKLDIERDRLDFEIPQSRTAEDGIRDIQERLIVLSEQNFTTHKQLTDAGIVVDKENGTVSIRAVDAVANRQNEVEIELDAVKGTIELSASKTWVNEALTALIVDPDRIPLLDDLTVQLNDVDILLDAESGRIDLLSTALTVEDEIVSMVSVTQRLDSVEETMTLTVSSDDFGLLEARTNLVEVSLSTLGDVSTLTQTVSSTRALTEDLKDLTEATIADVWAAWERGEKIKQGAASGQRQMQSSVDEMFVAEASERLLLKAEVENSVSLISQEALTRASDTEALGQLIDEIDVSINDPETGLAGIASTLDETIARVEATEDGLVAESSSTSFLGATVRTLDGLTEEQIQQAIWSEWDKVDRDNKAKSAIAVKMRQAEARVVEGLSSEASERLVLGAAIEDAKAEIVIERTARTTTEEASATEIKTLTARVEGSEGAITEINNIEATSSSALVQFARTLEATITDPATGLEAAHGAIEELNTIDAESDSVLVQFARTLEATIKDPTTGLEAAHGSIAELNTIKAESDSVLVQYAWDLNAVVKDPETGLEAAHGAISELNTIEADSDSVLVQYAWDLSAVVKDPETGLEAAHGAISELNTIKADSDSVLVQYAWDLNAVVKDPDTGLEAAHGAITELNTIKADSDSVLAQYAWALNAVVKDPTTGLEAAHGAITELNTVKADSDSVLAQYAWDMNAVITDPDTGIAAAHGSISELNTVEADSDSALVSYVWGLNATVNDPDTGLEVAHSDIAELNTVAATSKSALARRFAELEAEINEDDTGLSARIYALDSVGGRVASNETGLSSLVGRADIIEASMSSQQLIPNAEFAAGDLRGWEYVPEGDWEIYARGSTAATAVQNSPRLFFLRIVENATEFSQATAVKDLPVSDDQQFTLKLRGAARSGGNATVQVRFLWTDAEGTSLSNTVKEIAFSSTDWVTSDLGTVLDPIVPPENAAMLTVKLRRNAGGYGYLYLDTVRLERVTESTVDARARISTIEGSYVDADGALSAVESSIEAEFDGMLALAEASTYAKATADGIAAGYVWRLNGENLMEMVSVADGVEEGAATTFKLKADYVHITGLTQIDDAVLIDMVAKEAFIDNLTVTRGNIENTLKSDNFVSGSQGLKLNFANGNVELNQLVVRGDMVVDGDISTLKLGSDAVTREEYGYNASGYVSGSPGEIVNLSITRLAGASTKIEVATFVSGSSSTLSLSASVQRKIETGEWVSIHSRSLGIGSSGATNSFVFLDEDTTGGYTEYRVMTASTGELEPGNTAPSFAYSSIFATQLGARV